MMKHINGALIAGIKMENRAMMPIAGQSEMPPVCPECCPKCGTEHAKLTFGKYIPEKDSLSWGCTVCNYDWHTDTYDKLTMDGGTIPGYLSRDNFNKKPKKPKKERQPIKDKVFWTFCLSMSTAAIYGIYLMRLP